MVAFPTTRTNMRIDNDIKVAYLETRINGKSFNLVSENDTTTEDLPDEVQEQLLAVELVECVNGNNKIAHKVKTLDSITVDEVPYETHSTILLTATESVTLLHKKYPDAKWFKCWTIYRDFAIITPQYDDQPDLSHAKRFTR